MRKPTRALVLGALLAVAGLPVFTLIGAAQAPSAGRPLSPAVAYSENTNSHLLVWAEDLGTGTGMDLYALRLSATGLPTGRVLPVFVGAGNQSDPAIVFSRRVNQYLVVFTDDGQSTGAVPTPSGPIQPPVPGTPQPTPPTLPTPNPLWSDLGEPGLNKAVPQALSDAFATAQRLGIEGETLVGPHGSMPLKDPRSLAEAAVLRSASAGVASQAPGVTSVAVDQDGIVLELDGAGTTVLEAPLAFQQATSTPTPDVPPPSTPAPGGPGGPPGGPVSGSRDILGMWLSSYGQVVSNAFALVSSPGDDTFPDVDYKPGFTSDDYALVWREVVGTDITLSSVRMRGIGRYFVMDTKRSIVEGVDVGRPSVAADWSQGQYLVAWAETPKDEVSRDVYGRRLNANAFPFRPVFRVVRGPEDQTSPSLASLGNLGGYLLSWEQREVANPPDIMTRRLNANGYPWRPQHGLSAGPDFSFSPDLAPTRVRLETLLVWLQRNAAGDHIVNTARLNRDGRRIGPVRNLVIGGSASGVTPVPPPPNPGQPPVPPLPTP